MNNLKRIIILLGKFLQKFLVPLSFLAMSGSIGYACTIQEYYDTSISELMIENEHKDVEIMELNKKLELVEASNSKISAEIDANNRNKILLGIGVGVLCLVGAGLLFFFFNNSNNIVLNINQDIVFMKDRILDMVESKKEMHSLSNNIIVECHNLKTYIEGDIFGLRHEMADNMSVIDKRTQSIFHATSKIDIAQAINELKEQKTTEIDIPKMNINYKSGLEKYGYIFEMQRRPINKWTVAEIIMKRQFRTPTGTKPLDWVYDMMVEREVWK